MRTIRDWMVDEFYDSWPILVRLSTKTGCHKNIDAHLFCLFSKKKTSNESEAR